MSEIDLSRYRRVELSELGCLKLRTSGLKAFNRTELERFIKENCAGCGTPDALIFDQKSENIFVLKDSDCANKSAPPPEPPPRWDMSPLNDDPFDDGI